MIKTIKWFVVLLSLWVGQVFAIGFGDIKLYSYLNEPLDAEIELLSVDELNLSELTATLAPAADFQKINLERPYFLTKLRFDIVQQGDRAFIRVRSDEPMKRAFLEFLTLLSWPNGRLVRSYTLLFDPAPVNTGARSRLLNSEAALGFNPGLSDSGLSDFRQAHTQDLRPPTQWASASPNPTRPLERLFDEPENASEVSALTPIERGPAVSVASTQQAIVEQAKALAAQGGIKPPKAEAETFKTRLSVWTQGLYQRLEQLWHSVKTYQGIVSSSVAILGIAVYLTWVHFKRLQVQGVVRWEKTRFHQASEDTDPEFNIRLVLAKQYIALHDMDSAKQVLEAILTYGTQEQRKAAEDLFSQL